MPAPSLVCLPRRALRRTRLDPGSLHAPKLVLQVADLIPYPGGQLELKLGRGCMHLVSQLGNQRGQVGTRRAAALVGGTGGRPRPRRHARDRSLAATLLATRAAEQLLGVRVLPSELVQDVGDPLAQWLRVDAVLLVVGDLPVAAPVGLVDGALHGRRYLVGIHVYLARHVAGRPANRLNQRGS